MIGTTLAHFKITGELGSGGMGTVYQAEDEKLGREVALKVLPEAFVSDPERLARFEREARVLAALNHPSIAAIYEFGTAAPQSGDGQAAGAPIHFLVMELAPGETLAERIARGPILLAEALPLALRIAEALETAHEAGIVHRDLKPANVKVTPDGGVKVLDFGLAKAFGELGVGEPLLSQSPTLTARMTEVGMLLGTAAYMSPEQARGQAADKRADIWAFGCVLHEMLTGERLFAGPTVSDTLAAVLRAELDWGILPEDTPEALRRLIARCLERDSRRRLRDIGEARVALEELLAREPGGDAVAADATTASGGGRHLAGRLIPVLAALLVGLAAGSFWLRPDRTPFGVVQAEISAPEGTAFYLETINPGPAVLSPDGSRIVFSARDTEGVFRLYIRNLAQREAREVPGTEGANYPFWSPDGRWLGYFAQGQLWKVEATGGPSRSLAEALNGKGGSWTGQGVILFAPGADTPIYRVSEDGGDPIPVTEIDRERNNSHRHPRILPDDRHFLFLARPASAAGKESDVFLGSVEGGPTRLLTTSEGQAEVAADRLFTVHQRILMTQQFDSAALSPEGDASPLVEDLRLLTGAAYAIYSASPAGTLVYQTGQPGDEASLEWADRDGRPLGSLREVASYSELALSPDGKTVAVSVPQDQGTHDIWLYDLRRDVRTRFTFDPAEDFNPVWLPDSSGLVFTSARSAASGLYRKAVGGTSEAELLAEFEGPLSAFPSSVSPDGRWLAFSRTGKDLGNDIWLLPLDGDGLEARPLLDSRFDEVAGRFSPDGRWFMYSSNESGRPEIYARPLPGPGRKWQVSRDGGVLAWWGRDGREILYQEPAGNLVSVPIEIRGDSLQIGVARTLFTAPTAVLGIFIRVQPTADGRRFLMIRERKGQPVEPLRLVLDWQDLLTGHE